MSFHSVLEGLKDEVVRVDLGSPREARRGSTLDLQKMRHGQTYYIHDGWRKSVFFLVLWTLSHAAYISRMSTLSRLRAPVAFRPGVVLQRPVYPQRIVPAASRRAPYIMYRNTPHRYAIKHSMSPAPTRNIFSPWKTTRLPLPNPTADYEFLRAASPPAPSSIVHPDGAIHTIPAPNLSLSEKPIVVAESDSTAANDASDAPKPTYEVTEKYSDQPIYQANPKIESPIGFSKASTMSAADLQHIVRHNAALQLASEYGFPAIQLSQPTVQLPQPTIIPQQFSIQGFHGLTNPHDFMHRGAESIIIPQNTFYQQDPMFLHNLQGQILQQYPLEFRPYTPDQPQVQTQPPETQTPLFLLQNEQITKQAPSSFVASENNQKNIVQRETQESSIASIIPQGFAAENVSENLIDIDVTTISVPQNVTTETVTTETQGPTTTVKNVFDTNREDQRTTPIYYAQIGQSVGNVIANGFYSAINDVRAASIDAQNNKDENITTTTMSTTTQREIKSLFVNEEKDTEIDDLKNLLASPFEKAAESVNVAYTLLRANEKQPKVNQDGEVFAGQLVEAKISEDQEFNKEKATLANRPPLRLFAVTEKRVSETTPQRTVVKAKIPPKSKLTFDDKTGEPVLRIYASYVDNPVQRELLTAKLSNMKHTKEVTRKQDNFDWKADAVKSLEKSLMSDISHGSQFGLKLRSRSDDYIPIFEDYEE